MHYQNAIEIRGLAKNFPRFQLGPLDLSVPAGAIYGLVGPNGAGKTTTLDLIYGLGLPNAGEIRVLGCDHRTDEVAMKLAAAYVSPHTSYVLWKYVGRAIRFIRAFYPIGTRIIATICSSGSRLTRMKRSRPFRSATP